MPNQVREVAVAEALVTADEAWAWPDAIEIDRAGVNLATEALARDFTGPSRSR